MPTALVAIADGSEDIESVTIIDVLRRATRTRHTDPMARANVCSPCGERSDGRVRTYEPLKHRVA